MIKLVVLLYVYKRIKTMHLSEFAILSYSEVDKYKKMMEKLVFFFSVNGIYTFLFHVAHQFSTTQSMFKCIKIHIFVPYIDLIFVKGLTLNLFYLRNVFLQKRLIRSWKFK